MAAGSVLLIVESPKKAKTIGGILAGGYRVEASFGHVRDLPPRQLGVDVDHGFEPTYIPVARAGAHLAKLRSACAGASRVLLATDPDREGEAIAWHLVVALGLRPAQYSRVAFHEITARAVREAIAQPRALDQSLVDAQQARRILDRLVGYQVSPLLWRKVQKGSSAGRVQSVALRLVVEREREIGAFVPVESWSVVVTLAAPPEDPKAPTFDAALVELDGKRAVIPDREAAEVIVRWLEDPATRYTVAATERKTRERTPPPPFTTSTLQQAAGGRLRLGAKRTMALAQSLYEAGLITYHRTDAVYSAPEAVGAARDVIAGKFGPEYLPERPRHYANRQKSAQEAHEAIRPSDPARLPESIGGPAEERRLYELIWQRFLASQAAPARYLVDTALVDATGHQRSACLRARASTLVFPGYLAIYGVGEGEEDAPSEGNRTRGRSGEPGEDEDLPANRKLPELTSGEPLRRDAVTPTQRFSKPPPRFTEPSLVRALEALGVGRPSTYATILGTIEERGYVTLGATAGERLRAFVPTGLGFAANDFLCAHFAEVVDPEFTSRLEGGLDEVARGQVPWRELLGQFYERFARSLATARGAEKVEVPADPVPAPAKKGGRGRKAPGETAGRDRPAPVDIGEACPRCGKPLLRRVGKFGEFVGCSGYPSCRFTRDDRAGGAGDSSRAPRAPRRPAAGRRGRSASAPSTAEPPTTEAAPAPKSRGRRGVGARAPVGLAQSGDPTVSPVPNATIGATSPAPAGVCPRCGRALVTRTQRATGTQFLGCSGYPDCRFTRPAS